MTLNRNQLNAFTRSVGYSDSIWVRLGNNQIVGHKGLRGHVLRLLQSRGHTTAELATAARCSLQCVTTSIAYYLKHGSGAAQPAPAPDLSPTAYPPDPPPAKTKPATPIHETYQDFSTTFMNFRQMATALGADEQDVIAALWSTGRHATNRHGQPHGYGRAIVQEVARILGLPYSGYVRHQEPVVNVSHLYNESRVFANRGKRGKHIFGRMAG